MRLFLFIVASWVCIDRACRVHMASTRVQGNSFEEVSQIAPRSHQLSQQKHSRPSSRTGEPTTLKALALLLLRLNLDIGWQHIGGGAFAMNARGGEHAVLRSTVSMRQSQNPEGAQAVSRRAALATGLATSGLATVTAGFPKGAAANDGPYCLTCKIKKDLNKVKDFRVIDLAEVGPNPAAFEDVMRATLAKHDPAKNTVLVWVQSDMPDGVTPWCPDTREALPILERALYTPSTKGLPIVLVTADVVKGEYKANPKYAYVTNPQLKLKGVPTLYRWGRDGPTQRLTESEITDGAVKGLIA